MPARSTGCANCVKRKIRCDRRAEGCKRCDVHGVQCPGYPQDAAQGFIFKDVSAYTQNEAHKNYARIQHKNSVQRVNRHILSLLRVADGFVSEVSSASAQRVALHNEFLQTYLPRHNSPPSVNPLSFIEMLTFQAPQAQNTALQPAMDALGLVQLGSIAKDERLLKSAVALYGRSLSRLAIDLHRQDFRHSDDILASTIILSICELYEEISQNSGGWVRHVDGTNQILKIRGPKNIKSDLALALYSNARNNALVQGLISRKASYMETPAWRNLEYTWKPPSFSTIFYDSAIQIPGLLERTDELLTKPVATLESMNTLLADLSALEMNLRQWLGTWESSTGGRPLRILRPVGHFVHFSTHCPDRTLSRAYHFPSFHVGYLNSLYWMCMHALRTCTKQVAGQCLVVEPNWLYREHYVIPEDELLEYVLELCRCMPFFCEPLSGSIGHIAIFLPMRIAAMYFGPRGMVSWLKWIGTVKHTVFTQGLSPPLVGQRIFPPTGAPSQVTPTQDKGVKDVPPQGMLPYTVPQPSRSSSASPSQLPGTVEASSSSTTVP